eukprot:GCRY01001169.1.p1 GENE.GCRY01001169.1~~GCRY01001169.1.p1  ORF type:complete len:489 (+),score=103.72 GCRY01001169.1:375-1841(+)
MAAANGVKRIIVGQEGIMSTPAMSAVIRKKNVFGGIILTASHNPGGPFGDFGIKFNCANGGPAPESTTSLIFEQTKTLSEYHTADIPDVNLSQIAVHTYEPDFSVEVIDPVEDYLVLMKEIFDFDSIRKLVVKPGFSILCDGLHGVDGSYAQRIFCEELGVPEESLIRCNPLEDFGGFHPDPNLTYAADMVQRVKEGKKMVGFAWDGDGDRNMIVSHDTFVNPSDAIAVFAANAASCIPYFKDGFKGVARSMPTSQALDYVAKAQDLSLYEVPTGWKFFGNLMDAGKLSLCGEESFGNGSDHIREKDGMWASLVWLSILAHYNKNHDGAAPEKWVTLKEIMSQHWSTFGRNYFTRYDYEGVTTEQASKVMEAVRTFQNEAKETPSHALCPGEKVALVDDFEYTDPIDHSVTSHQGLRIIFDSGSRIVYRLSGTGSSGATIRVYIERYNPGPEGLEEDAQVALANLVKIALSLSEMEKHTGRKEPTVIT